jgi:uncharacterized protein YneF (UPF0154 family)
MSNELLSILVGGALVLLGIVEGIWIGRRWHR